jgi:uncharacterized protein YnzC (UPF0291/DUF896 family)
MLKNKIKKIKLISKKDPKKEKTMNIKFDIKIKLIKMMEDEIETQIQLRKGYIKKIKINKDHI